MRNWILTIIWLLIGGVNIFASPCGSSTPLIGIDTSGNSDVSLAIQLALNAAVPRIGGNGNVSLLPGFYRLEMGLVIPESVTLCGTVGGPLEPLTPYMPIPPKALDEPLPRIRGAMLLIAQNQAPGVNMLGLSSALRDLQFFYPDQVRVSASIPLPYPPAVAMNRVSTISGITIINAYDGVFIAQGRTTLRDSYIGAFRNGITIDGPPDMVIIDNINQSIWWDIAEGFNTPQPIDTWVMNNSNGLVVGRVDSLHVSKMLIFCRRVGISLGMVASNGGYGSFSDIDLDSVKIGIVVFSSNKPGFMFSNLLIGGGGGNYSALYFMPGADVNWAPLVLISNGIARGAFSLGAIYNPPAGRLLLSNWMVE